jgi:hypothetical protein
MSNHFAEELDALTNTSVDIKSLGLHVKVKDKCEEFLACL